ncbi:unnamed protein product [Malus baccata var. baccata]
MVTAAQLQIVQSSITSLIPNVSTSVTIKLDDTNYLVWHYQMQWLLESHGILGFVDGSRKCPTRFIDDCNIEGIETDAYQVWKMHDRAVMQLIIATLSITGMSCIIGCTAYDMWVNLKDRFSTVTKANIFQLKIELQNIKKGSESVSQYLQRVKDARDHLATAGVPFNDDDIVIIALKGLSSEYNTFRIVIRGRDNVISLKDFRAQLLAEETTLENSQLTGSFIPVMLAQGDSSKGNGLLLAESSSHLPDSSSPSSQYQIDSSSHSNGTSASYHNGGHSYNSGGYKGSKF